MKVKKLSGKVQDAQQIPTLFDHENIMYYPINIVNWKEYPYQPQVSFRIAYTNDAILVHYKVVEDSVRAKYGEDNGSVWTDSCVEFFSIPARDGVYYNLECNCIATILLAAGSERSNREMAPLEITDQVKRWASLGRETFEEKIGECTWEVALQIPYKVFFKHCRPRPTSAGIGHRRRWKDSRQSKHGSTRQPAEPCRKRPRHRRIKCVPL